MPRVFISYRRESGWALAGRLYDMLVDKFGADNIFIDIEDIEPGVDFVSVLEEVLAETDALIPIIDRDWANVTDAEGKRRLDDINDFVRQEVSTALKRNILVLPLLEPGANMPTADRLPEDLRELTRRNAIEVTQKHFRADVDKIVELLEALRSEADLAHLGRHAETAARILVDEAERTRWERNYWIQYAYWAPAIGGAFGLHTMRAPLLQRLERLDFSTDSDLEAARDKLLWLIRKAPEAQEEREEKCGRTIVYDLLQTPEITLLLEEIDEALDVRGKFALEAAVTARKRALRAMEVQNDEFERWRRNWKIHQAVWVPGMSLPWVGPGTEFKRRESLLDLLDRLDFSRDSALDAKRNKLVKLIKAAPEQDVQGGGGRRKVRYDLQLTPDIKLLRDEIDAAVKERGEVAQERLQAKV